MILTMIELNITKKTRSMEQKIFQGHADHFDGIMDSQALVEKGILQKVLKDALFNDVVKRRGYPDVTYLKYTEKEMGIDAILVLNEETNTLEFISGYPTQNGVDIEVEIEEVYIWDNGIEATIECSHDAWEFAFFATDYLQHQKMYKKGNHIKVNLSALGIIVEKPMESFSFEGQQAIDWYTRTGQEPRRDENGNVLPAIFDLSKMVAFLNTKREIPDIAEFQSPVSSLEEQTFLGIDFLKTQICVCNHDNTKVEIPLFFRKEMMPQLKVGNPIRGCLWLSANISIDEETLYQMLYDGKISRLEFVKFQSTEIRHEFYSFCRKKKYNADDKAAEKFFDWMFAEEEKAHTDGLD